MDEEELEEPKTAWLEMGVVLGVLMSFLPLSWVLGLASFSEGGKYQGIVSLVGALPLFLIFFIAVHIFLVWPMTTLSAKQWNAIPEKLLRVAVLIILASAPLISFAYYRAGIRTLGEFYDLILIVLFPAGLGALYYERYRKPFLLTLWLSVPVFFSLYVMGDLLLPHRTLFYFTSQGPGIYVLRALTTVAAVWIAVYIGRDRSLRHASFGYGLLGLVVLAWVLQFAIPMVAGLIEGLGIHAYWEWDYAFLVPLVALALVVWQKPWARTPLFAVAAGGVLWAAWTLVKIARAEVLGTSDIARLLYHGMAIGLFFWLALEIYPQLCAKKPGTRS